jgi:hypothetical protein
MKQWSLFCREVENVLDSVFSRTFMFKYFKDFGFSASDRPGCNCGSLIRYYDIVYCYND